MGFLQPDQEAARLEALRRYRLLDTGAEQVFDDIAAAAAALCDAPVALVSLIDTDRQWFKARVGLDAQETPREVAFCDHAIRRPDATMIVEDATRDERFKDNPLVTSAPDIRFYMGAPLCDPEGHALGTLCVIDRKPRRPTAARVAGLEALRRVAMHTILQRNAARELAAAYENVKLLSGLLPICSYCKAIRNDQGYWDSVAEYIGRHAAVDFSHGICPDCAKRHFPGFTP